MEDPPEAIQSLKSRYCCKGALHNISDQPLAEVPGTLSSANGTCQVR